MFKALPILSLIAILTLSSCATILKGGHQSITFSTNTPGANVQVVDHLKSTVAQVVTPGTVKLKRGSGYFKGQPYGVVVTQEGYETAGFNLIGSANVAYYIGNLPFLLLFGGGLISYLVIDPLTGAMWNLEATNVVGNASVIQGNNQISITLKEDKESQKQ